MEDNILQLFLEDTREHLNDIESDLLDIEAAGTDYDPELVNKVFRTAHSIKGSAGFLGLNTIRDLSHKIETVLDRIRSREMVPNSQVINIVLKAFDRLQELVDNIHESEQMDIAPHIATLTDLLAGNLTSEQQATVTRLKNLSLPDGRIIFQISEYDLLQARRGGNFIYLVEYDLIHDVHKKNKNPLDLLRFLEKSGLILDCKVDLGCVGDLECPPSNRLPFFVLYASILEPDLVQAIFQIDSNYIHSFEEKDSIQTEPAVDALVEQKPLLPAQQGPVRAEEVTSLEEQLSQAMSNRNVAPEMQTAQPPGQTDAKGAATTAPETDTAVADSSTAERRSERIHDFELAGAGNAGVLTLSGSLTVERAAKVKEALLRGLDCYSDLTVTLNDVAEADVSLLQLLIAAHKSAQRTGARFSAAPGDASGPVLAVAARAGLDAELLRRYGLA